MFGDEWGDRGRLRIILGSAPGVGKTWAMLREGHRLKEAGKDVVVGLVETHGRVETEAQIGDLEVLPRLIKTHGGVQISELDVRGVLARQPEIVLIDELAHTNGPGSARAKRWEDVQVLLDAGMDVITTLNVQHLESLNHVVESITGVAVRETVPDKVVGEADEIQLVDLPVDSLIERMEAGKIYPEAQAQTALRHFFRPGNLTALRELALRRMAADVDEQLEEYMREHDIEDVWPAAERVLVWLQPGADAGMILRKAWRVASGLRGELVAAIPADAERNAEARRIARLAEDLGAAVRWVDPGAGTGGIVATVQAENAQILVLGHAPERGWRNRLGRNLIEELHTALDNVDIYLVEGKRA